LGLIGPGIPVLREQQPCGRPSGLRGGAWRWRGEWRLSAAGFNTRAAITGAGCAECRLGLGWVGLTSSPDRGGMEHAGPTLWPMARGPRCTKCAETPPTTLNTGVRARPFLSNGACTHVRTCAPRAPRPAMGHRAQCSRFPVLIPTRAAITTTGAGCAECRLRLGRVELTSSPDRGSMPGPLYGPGARHNPRTPVVGPRCTKCAEIPPTTPRTGVRPFLSAPCSALPAANPSGP
jgi:hypothetical protein